MIKLVLFDLDGVLIDAKKIHFSALNKALPKEYQITEQEHISTYDGLKTKQKLQMLTERKGLPLELHDFVYKLKQTLTFEEINKLEPIPHLLVLFKALATKGFKIGVCSNSIRKTVIQSLSRTGLIEYCDVILSNEDVINSKPHPEMYWKAMSTLGVMPEETLIVEDSPTGIIAAQRSGAQHIRVKDVMDTKLATIHPHLYNAKPFKKVWQDKNLNVLIPMAGAGSRFAEAGYALPKPLIDVEGKMMINVVLDNLGLDANYIFIVQQEHLEKYNLDTILNLMVDNPRIVVVDGLTEGAACTTLLAKEFIDNDKPLFIANSDQYVEWDVQNFMYQMQERDCDAGIVTFNADDPKWSYAKVDENGLVTKVAEKFPISDEATVGFYYWKHGADYVKYAEQMIKREIRVKGEFYVCPVFNEAIDDCKQVRTFRADRMWGLGTPDDLTEYLAR